MQKRVIKIMPDYQCSPLWYIGRGTVENVPPDKLPLSDSLKSTILDWQKVYDDTLNFSNPAASGFKTSFEEIIFDKEGLKIWEQMIKELSELYEVKYFSVKDQTLYEV